MCCLKVYHYFVTLRLGLLVPQGPPPSISEDIGQPGDYSMFTQMLGSTNAGLHNSHYNLSLQISVIVPHCQPNICVNDLSAVGFPSIAGDRSQLVIGGIPRRPPSFTYFYLHGTTPIAAVQ
jgi:hypothetical protein